MTPHLLRLTAFGPFAASVTVDLDALAGAGLFLLHGPTGAGKTTLLDGLGFALFGRVPGVRNAAKRLRADQAEAALRTEVQLEVTLSGRRMRITRSPQQERAKARGSGTTVEPARVLLEELVEGDWVCVSTRVGEADLEIADLVGMSAEQFFQVVLLPQGDFAQFLRASSVDRAAVLQKLFGTERFADVEVWLSTRRRLCAEQVACARAELSKVVARVAEVAGVPPWPQPVDLSGSFVDAVPAAEGSTNAALGPVRWAAALLDTCQAEQTRLQLDLQVATAERDRTRAAAVLTHRLRERQQRLVSVLARQADLAAAEPLLVLTRAELDAAHRAREAAGAIAQVAERRRARDDALGAEAVARSGLSGTGLDVDLGVDDLRGQLSSGRERYGRLEALRAVDAARQEAVAEAAKAGDEEADALAAHGAACLVLEGLPARRVLVVAQLATARAAAERLPALANDRDRLAALRPDLVELGRVSTQMAVLGEQHLSARETALALAIKANDLRTASINTMIARLAFALESDAPCPVCGSLEHPDPSLLQDEGVSSDDEERSRLEAERAQRDVADLETRQAAAMATAAALRSRLGALTLEALDLDLAERDLVIAAAREDSRGAGSAEGDLEQLDQGRVTATSAVVAAEGRAEAAQRRKVDATARARAAQDQLDRELFGLAADLAGALGALGNRLTACERALEASADLAYAQAELDRAVSEAEAACGSAGFASVDSARSATRSSPWLSTTGEQLREAGAARAGVLEALADPELDVELDPPAPVAAVTALASEAEVTYAEAVGRSAQAQARRTGLERLLPVLERESSALLPLEERAAEVRGLAELCAGAGANALKMTLTAFVLAARLEEVAAAASVRLLRMTQGRFELVHTDGAARAGQRSGLGLLARDGWTGQDRDTSTLSGGETFLASLALALGLADVVTAEAGGSRIGALFVDEGFGTLDEDALDEVMDVLDGLREGGRVVGVVSHVAELRQRIPAQVEVRKTRSGSNLVLHGC